MVFYYKARVEQPPFKMGSRRFLRYCDKNYDPYKETTYEPIPVTSNRNNKKKGAADSGTKVIKRTNRKIKKEGRSITYRRKKT